MIFLINPVGFTEACRVNNLTVHENGNNIFVWASEGDLTEVHVHIIYDYNRPQPYPMTILPKYYATQRPNLENIPTAQWAAAVNHMRNPASQTSPTIRSVELLRTIIDTSIYTQ